MLTTYLFRYTLECTISQSNFQNFLRLRRQRGIDPPSQNPADVPAHLKGIAEPLPMKAIENCYGVACEPLRKQHIKNVMYIAVQ